jgi:hypothetical protein
MEAKLCVLIIDPKFEKKLRNKILKILSRKVKGELISLRQSAIHKMISCNLRAAYLGYVLQTMQEEKLLMNHHGNEWALWDAQISVARREWREKCQKEYEEWEIAWQNSPAGIAEGARKEAERARIAQEKFNAKMRKFLTTNEEALFELVQRVYHDYMPKANFRNSRLTHEVSTKYACRN